MTTNKYVLQLTYMSDISEVLNIMVPRANASLQPTDIKTAMNRIKNAGIVATSKGSPSIVLEAELIKTGTTDFEV